MPSGEGAAAAALRSDYRAGLAGRRADVVGLRRAADLRSPARLSGRAELARKCPTFRTNAQAAEVFTDPRFCRRA
jgi:hypothetical protein